jgi:hypothetical protein
VLSYCSRPGSSWRRGSAPALPGPFTA